MIILTNEILENNSKLVHIIEKEKEVISLSLKSQENLKSLLLDTMQKFAIPTKSINTNNSNKIIQLFNYFKESLELSNKNISALNELLKQFYVIEKLDKSNIDSMSENINNFNTAYLETNENVLNNTLQIEKTLSYTLSSSDSNMVENDLEITPTDNTSSVDTAENDIPLVDTVENNTPPVDTVENNIPPVGATENDTPPVGATENDTPPVGAAENDTPPVDAVKKDDILEISADNNSIKQTDNPNIVENTLIVSELKRKVFLPYTVSSLNSTLKENPDKYSNIEELIEKEYVIPYELFRSPAIARFREAFKLVRYKNKGSIKEAFDLGMELLFNYNLHPAIISACRNLDELDIYLDYLENSETDKFDCFQIKFEIAPTKIP